MVDAFGAGGVGGYVDGVVGAAYGCKGGVYVYAPGVAVGAACLVYGVFNGYIFKQGRAGGWSKTCVPLAKIFRTSSICISSAAK